MTPLEKYEQEIFPRKQWLLLNNYWTLTLILSIINFILLYFTLFSSFILIVFVFIIGLFLASKADIVTHLRKEYYIDEYELLYKISTIN